MPSLPRRLPRSKTISAQGITGQKGINLIERIVLDMESRWTPSGPNEVGIDGYIELFDPATRKPLGRTLAVQSKVVSAISADSSPTFKYRCDPADLEYWLSGSMPVILVVSSPTSKEAYWVSVKDYFKGWAPANSTIVNFKKCEQSFTADSFHALLAVAAPTEGLYLSPLPKKERLYSNLLRVDAFPERIFVGDTECRWAMDVWALLHKNRQDADAGWVLRSKRLISFHDLSEEPWATICDMGTVDSFPTSDWSDSTDPDRQRVLVRLLNQTLRAQLSPRVRYWPMEGCFAICGEAKKLKYRSLKRKSRISIVSEFSKQARDGRIFKWRRHMAFRGQFRLFDAQWYLEITPTYRFTRDGFELDRFHEDRLKRIKQLEGNRAVLSGILFWADYLGPHKTLFKKDMPPIRFGDLLTFESAVGVNDDQWLEDKSNFNNESLHQNETLVLPDFEELFN